MIFILILFFKKCLFKQNFVIVIIIIIIMLKPITYDIRIFIYDFFYYLYKYGATLIYPKIKYLNVYDLNYLPQLFIFVCVTKAYNI